jgi:hypothetical protein
MAKSISKFVIRFFSIGLAILLVGLIPIKFGILYVILAGLIIESIRRILRLIIFNKKFGINKHFLFWIIFQAGFFYLSSKIVNLFSLDYIYRILLITLIISLLNLILKSLKIEDLFFSLFKIRSHKRHYHNKGNSYYNIGLQNVPSDVLRSWRRSMSKREFKSAVESSGYKFVHGG